MYYVVSEKHKIIFGWSAKAGCTHIKQYFLKLTNQYGSAAERSESTNLQTAAAQTHIHQNFFYNSIDINQYKNRGYNVFLFIRNPFKRIVSAYINRVLQCYDIHITFEQCLELNPIIIDKHHFINQTEEQFSLLLIPTKIYDIEFIDYNYINSLFNTHIDSSSITYGNYIKYNTELHKHNYIGNTLKFCINNPPNYKAFYNKKTIDLVKKIYKKDFDQWGFNYTI